MISRLIVIALITLLAVSQPLLATDASQCRSLLKVDPIDRKAISKACLKVARSYEKERNYGKAAWYYLLSGKTKYVVDSIAPRITVKDGYFINAGHACILSDNTDCAKSYYQAFLILFEYLPNRKTIDGDFDILKSLYPDKKTLLEQGKHLLEELYKKSSAMDPKIKQANMTFTQDYPTLNDYDRIKRQKSLIALFREGFGELNIPVATLYANLGIAYSNTGQYDKAIENKRKALQLRIQLLEEDDVHLGDSYNDMGVAYSTLGNNKEAYEYFTYAAGIYEKQPKPDPRRLSPLYAMMATSLEALGDKKQAKLYRKKAKKISKSSTDTLVSAYVLIQEAESLIMRKKFSQAIKNLDRAKKIEKQKFVSDPLALSQIELNYAEAYLHWGKPNKALKHAKKALKVTQDANYRFGTLQSLEKIGWIYYSKHKFKKANHYAQKGFDLFLQERDSAFAVLGDNDKNLFLKSSQDLLTLMIESAYLSRSHDNNVSKSTFNNWLRYKGSIFDATNLLSVAHSQTKNQALKHDIETLMSTKRELANLYQSSASDNYHRWQSINKLNDKIHKLYKKISAKVDKLASLERLKYIKVSDVAKNLQKNEVYVDFAHIRNSYFVYALIKNGDYIQYRIDQKRSGKIDKYISEFRQKIAKGEKYSKKKLGKLYDLLSIKNIFGIKGFENKKHIILSPDGMLRLFPFEALYDTKQKKYMLENYTIHYIPNAKELLRLHTQKSKKRPKEIVVFAYPDYNIPDGIESNASKDINRSVKLRNVFVPLAGAKAEAEAINKIFGYSSVKVFMDKNASEKNLFAVQSPRILHISTHGYFDHGRAPDPMLRSAIVLTGANYAYTTGSGNGIVTALKLSGLYLDGTELVVLSACETGVMDAKDTDSISGLSKAFIVAGAQDVMVSLWSVSDQGTLDLMKLFYKEVKNGRPYHQALRLAKIKMIKNGAPAYIWAPFILNGK